jgi:hypothetical protein
MALEHVLQHKGSRGHSFVYELLYNGEGKDGKPFVLGLVDVEKLRREEAGRLAKDAGSAKTGELMVPTAPAEPVESHAEPSEEAEPATTTFDSSGLETRFAGGSRAIRGLFAGGSRGQESGSGPAPEAASPDSEPKAAENALIPPARKARSYTLKPVVPGQAEGNGNGHRPLRLLRFNLLRRPAITLSRGSTKSARIRPGPDASLPAGA